MKKYIAEYQTNDGKWHYICTRRILKGAINDCLETLRCFKRGGKDYDARVVVVYPNNDTPKLFISV